MGIKHSSNQIKSIVGFVLIVLVFNGSLGVRAQSGSQVPASHWRDIQNKIFAFDDTDQLKPKQLLSKLEELAQIYSSASDQETINRRNRIDRLIECSKTDLDHCNRRNFNVHKQLHEYYQIFKKDVEPGNDFYKLNWAPYLDHYTKKLFSNCLSNYKELLGSRIQQIADDEKADAEQLYRVLTRINYPGFKFKKLQLKSVVPYDFMVAVSIQFMSQKISRLNVKEWISDATHYGQYFNQHLIQVCSRVHEAVDPINAMGEIMGAERKFKSKVRRLMKLGSVCGKIISHSDELMRDSFSKLQPLIVSANKIRRRELLAKLGCGGSIDLADLENEGPSAGLMDCASSKHRVLGISFGNGPQELLFNKL